MSRRREGLRIEGTVAPGFESVRELYAHNMKTLEERNTQLCVYHRGEKVVDLWATAVGDDGFSPDSLINVFSSGKSFESIAVASLVGKGLLDYAARVSDYWPEFAENGKGDLTIAELMRHEAGLAAFDTALPPEDLLPEHLAENRVGRVIEAQTQHFPRGTSSRREYHAVTRGWIVNEIFRRVDPAGRTIGQFLREEISGPLGIDAIIGVRTAELARRSLVKPLGFFFQLLQSLLPRRLGRRIELNLFQILGRVLRILPAIRHTTVRSAPPPFKGMDRIGFFNEPAVAMGETPSANTHSTARGLATVAAMMAAGGTWQGKQYLTEAAWRSMHEGAVPADMAFIPTAFTQGGVNAFGGQGPPGGVFERALNTGREGFHGWMGLGGSIFQWHRELEIGFGYVPTSLNVIDIMNERGKAYQAEVVRCVERLSKRTEELARSDLQSEAG